MRGLFRVFLGPVIGGVAAGLAALIGIELSDEQKKSIQDIVVDTVIPVAGALIASKAVSAKANPANVASPKLAEQRSHVSP